jgi:REP element-mobilizing transposase RayT
MARALRIEYPDAVYHVTCRGNAREAVFVGDGDRAVFLDLLGEVVGRFGWRCHAYCLMDNHYHLLVQTPTPNLGRGMRHLNGVYSQRFNRAHGRAGHVFQGRYKAILVERDAYLLELCRYVVLNPVRAETRRRAEDWRWSSYRATAGLCQPADWRETGWVLEQFGRSKARARENYRRLVSQGGGADGPWGGLVGGAVLGGEALVKSVAAGQGVPPDAETPRRRRHPARPALDTLVAPGVERAEWMGRAWRQYGYTLSEIANPAGLHYSSVSKIIKGWKDNID